MSSSENLDKQTQFLWVTLTADNRDDADNGKEEGREGNTKNKKKPPRIGRD